MFSSNSSTAYILSKCKILNQLQIEVRKKKKKNLGKSKSILLKKISLFLNILKYSFF